MSRLTDTKLSTCLKLKLALISYLGWFNSPTFLGAVVRTAPNLFREIVIAAMILGVSPPDPFDKDRTF